MALRPVPPGLWIVSQFGSNVAHLFDRNAKINIQDNGWNFTVRQTERGADINARDKNGETPLHHATRQGVFDGDDNGAQELAATVRVLLMAGAYASIRNAEGKRPIDLAAENESLKGTDTYWQLNDAGYENRGENPRRNAGEPFTEPEDFAQPGIA